MRLLLLPLGLALLAGCATTIPQINERPAKYYQQSVTFTGRIARTQDLPGEHLFEVADPNERRVLVRIQGDTDVAPGDWITVTGVLTPEVRIGPTTLYDVVTAESVRRVHAPRLRNLF
ncbi:MAG: hypothetical protein U0807_02955 [Candidatus Binatia bacterium]